MAVSFSFQGSGWQQGKHYPSSSDEEADKDSSQNYQLHRRHQGKKLGCFERLANVDNNTQII